LELNGYAAVVAQLAATGDGFLRRFLEIEFNELPRMRHAERLAEHEGLCSRFRSVRQRQLCGEVKQAQNRD
jgi:hypothetical protein